MVNMKRGLMIGLILAVFLVSGIAGCEKEIVETGIPECDWQPSDFYYGPCEAECPAISYFDNLAGKCKIHATSGCDCPEALFEINETEFLELMDQCSVEDSHPETSVYKLISDCEMEGREEAITDKNAYLKLQEECREKYMGELEALKTRSAECRANVIGSKELNAECVAVCEK